ncbi:hypothetical protein QUF80_02100 [Desulfococcaceae bacterium HSG8]|nr:hypothetical protein [Desulfococcaceae bacterium HSG8]
MSFQNFTSPDTVAKKYQLVLRQEEPFDYEAVSPIQPDSSLKKMLDFELRHQPRNLSEHALCESLIYPLLREIWMRHPRLQIWSHVSIQADEELTGVPDYLIAGKSPQGLGEIEIPMLSVIEAKKENFLEGWGQCLAGMVAAQKLNAGLTSAPTIYGIVTTGKTWEFAQLTDSEVKIHPFGLSLRQTDVLLGVLDYVFACCESQLESVTKMVHPLSET